MTQLAGIHPQLAQQLSTLDQKERPGQWKPANLKRPEADYARQLKSIGQHVGDLISGVIGGENWLEKLQVVMQLLDAYARALRPWALSTARKMLNEVDARDRESWRSLGNAISVQLHRDLQRAPVGERVQELLEEQVSLITSIPREAAQRVHELAIKGLEDSSRGEELYAEVMRSGDVAESRGILIARTETSRTATVLVQTRAEYVGSEGYTWETAKDSDVRQSHQKMQGKLVRWDSPPTLDKLTGHAGALPNCRCWCRAVLSEVP